MMRAAILCLILLASGCASIAQPDAAALLKTPTTPDGRAELQQVVKAALGRSDVTLSDDALTRSSLLVIEQKPVRDASGQRLSGRDFGKPEQFNLVMRGKRCLLIHHTTGQAYTLKAAPCVRAE